MAQLQRSHHLPHGFCPTLEGVRQFHFNLPRGPVGVLLLVLAGTVGLFLVFWLITTLWVLAVGAGIVGALAYGWRRLEARFRRGRWRRLPERVRRWED